MFREIKKVAQKKDEGIRRWFEDSYFDLIIWYNKDKTIRGFQLCYNRYGDEHALTWYSDHGYYHDKVHGGDSSRGDMTPILVANGPFPGDSILTAFTKSASSLDSDIAQLVTEKLDEYIKKVNNVAHRI
ncbi:hypothetical protein F9K33_16405 [bacterium]|nr:MAG: hypothetical protein F9K33_16405 [bacterium]